nr:DUF2264 domain-containing protein [Nonomuraea polychroma]
MADHLLASVAPYATDDFAQFRLPGRTSRSGQVSDGLEGFARTSRTPGRLDTSLVSLGASPSSATAATPRLRS